MTFKLFRRGSARCIGLLSAFVTILLCLYYISVGQPTLQPKDATTAAAAAGIAVIGASYLPQQHFYTSKSYPHKVKSTKNNNNNNEEDAVTALKHRAAKAAAIAAQHFTSDFGTAATLVNNPDWGDKCYVLDESVTNITAADEYEKFDFQPEWIRTKEYWDRGFEERFDAQKTDKKRPPLKVIVVPHSHNDPGWLKTFVNYFISDSRQILNLMVTKMQEYTDMTFIWSEISFLQLWWDQAHPTKQRALKRLINSGRLEITTGGWVMTDEANVHLYAMLDQLIEGHQWLRTNLNVTPTTGWSIDPFGHGSTVPYLLSGSNFEGTIIQRIHYAWKQWFARQQKGDFIWTPYWQQRGKATTDKRGQMLTHNMPFDIYSIKGSCGPHPFICLNFDFRKIPGEYTEYSIKAQFITEDNIEEKAQLLLEQYARTASLFPHNVALIPVGDDFRYNKEREVDQQYTNYKKLIDHIMANKRLYNVDIAFGTPRDYFNAIRKRSASFPTFKGDFFVYSDIFSEGRPAYWSGYFTTRPFYKILSADLEHNLRSAELLFTIAYNTARQSHHENAIKIFEKNYEKIIHARRNLGLFQHHDAITGTSKAAVMRDYGMRLFDSIQDMVKMQESTIELLIQNGTTHHKFLLSELERDSFIKLPRKTPIPLTLPNTSGGELGGSGGGGENTSTVESAKNAATASFVIFNALAQRRLEVVTLRTQHPNVKILNDRGDELRQVQINPVWNISDIYAAGNDGFASGAGHIRISTRQYEVLFVADLDALSLTTFRVLSDNVNYKRTMATVYCDECTEPTSTSTTATTDNEFVVKAKPAATVYHFTKSGRDWITATPTLEIPGLPGSSASYDDTIWCERPGGQYLPFHKKWAGLNHCHAHFNYDGITGTRITGKFFDIRRSTIFKKVVEIKPQQSDAGQRLPGDIQLENNRMRLLFDEKSGFLKTITRKGKDQKLLQPMQCAIKFAAYRSAQFHSGAYLFKTDPEQSEAEKDVLEQYEDVRVIITSGPIASDVTVIYGPFLAHTVRIFNTHTHLDAAIYIENDIDFEPPPKNRETELFMRFITDIDNIAPSVHKDVLKEGSIAGTELPEFYSDQNGFQYHKRTKVPAIGIEGNYFPITTGAFMQDSRVRFTLLTTHAQGAASYEPGQLEVMLDRRTLYDDYRGMGEGIVDNHLTRHKFFVLIEDMPSASRNSYQVPSLLATQLANDLRYPPNLYFVETFDDAPAAMQLKPKVLLLDYGALPCDVHLLNFRTLSDEQLQLFPSSSALLVLQRQGYDCAVGQPNDLSTICPFKEGERGLGRMQFNRLRLDRLETTSLTGNVQAHERKLLKSFAEITLNPMDLRTLNVTFRAG